MISVTSLQAVCWSGYWRKRLPGQVRRLHWNLTWFIACQLALLASSAKLTLLRKSGSDKQLNEEKYQTEVKLVLINYKGEDFSIRKSR